MTVEAGLIEDYHIATELLRQVKPGIAVDLRSKPKLDQRTKLKYTNTKLESKVC